MNEFIKHLLKISRIIIISLESYYTEIPATKAILDTVGVDESQNEPSWLRSNTRKYPPRE